MGLVCNVKVIYQHNVYGIEFQTSSTAGDKTNVRVVISRSRNRYVCELRYRQSEHLPDEVVQGSVQEQEKEHSQSDRSEDYWYHPMKLTVLSAAPKQLSQFANPNHLKTGRSESNLCLCGECWPNGSKFSSLMEMMKVPLIVPALDARSQILSFNNRRNGIGKPVFKLAPFGNGQLFTLVAPDLCVPGVSGEVFQWVICQASTATV